MLLLSVAAAASCCCRRQLLLPSVAAAASCCCFQLLLLSVAAALQHTLSCCTPRCQRDEAEQLDIELESLIEEGLPTVEEEDDGASEMEFPKR